VTNACLADNSRMASSTTNRRAETAVIPLWTTAREIRQLLGISAHCLQDYVDAGYVRAAKLKPAQQGGRVYCVADALAMLEALAAGLEPPQAPRGMGRSRTRDRRQLSQRRFSGSEEHAKVPRAEAQTATAGRGVAE
jgi:hypothetical protein